MSGVWLSALLYPLAGQSISCEQNLWRALGFKGLAYMPIRATLTVRHDAQSWIFLSRITYFYLDEGVDLQVPLFDDKRR